CLVARGASDLYYMHSSIVDAKLRAVDIAGAVLIVREAGGLVLDLKKKELDMALTSTARTDLVAVGDRRTLEVLPGSSGSPPTRTSRARWIARSECCRGSNPNTN